MCLYHSFPILTYYQITFHLFNSLLILAFHYLLCYLLIRVIIAITPPKIFSLKDLLFRVSNKQNTVYCYKGDFGVCNPVRLDRLAPDITLSYFHTDAVPYNDLDIQDLIATGGYSRVSVALWKDKRVAVCTSLNMSHHTHTIPTMYIYM